MHPAFGNGLEQGMGIELLPAVAGCQGLGIAGELLIQAKAPPCEMDQRVPPQYQAKSCQ